MSAVLEAKALTKRYARRTVVRDVSFRIDAGERVGVVGESGSGKSTVAKMVVGLESPSAGSVCSDGFDVERKLSTRRGTLEYRRMVQLVAQDTTSTFDPRHTVRTSLRVPAQILGGAGRGDADRLIDDVLGEIGIDPALVDRYPRELSGGQRQRMAIARALIVRPSVLVCDEAVSALDVSVQGAVLNLLKRYSVEHGLAILSVSHGLPATAFLTERLIVMNRGEVVETGPTSAVLSQPQHPYTQALVAAYREIESTQKEGVSE